MIMIIIIKRRGKGMVLIVGDCCGLAVHHISMAIGLPTDHSHRFRCSAGRLLRWAGQATLGRKGWLIAFNDR
ncbi:hypothetical protein BDV10DRAFT_95859 [Aspergillus recurvatus]